MNGGKSVPAQERADGSFWAERNGEWRQLEPEGTYSSLRFGLSSRVVLAIAKEEDDAAIDDSVSTGIAESKDRGIEDEWLTETRDLMGSLADKGRIDRNSRAFRRASAALDESSSR
tara:strand:- start:1445 stop:1792 length:348 start_codon:yes stop_codon:yes gene_type:complete